MITVRLVGRYGDLSIVLYIIYQFRAFVKTLKIIEEYARNIKIAHRRYAKQRTYF